MVYSVELDLAARCRVDDHDHGRDDGKRDHCAGKDDAHR